MFKNIVLILLAAANIASMISFQLNQTIDNFSINVIITGLTIIISALYLIVRTSRLNTVLAIITLLLALYHASMLVMRVYSYVYA